MERSALNLLVVAVLRADRRLRTLMWGRVRRMMFLC
jgi:hypothetical protein